MKKSLTDGTNQIEYNIAEAIKHHLNVASVDVIQSFYEGGYAILVRMDSSAGGDVWVVKVQPLDLR